MCRISALQLDFNFYQLSTAVISCWRLLTADDSCYEKNFTGIFMYTLKLILVLNFSSLAWFLFSPAVNSCHELLTAVDNWWQLIWKKFDWNFYLHTKVDTCAEFQLSSLIFIFISCQQLLSAVDSWWQLLPKKIKWDFHLPPKADICAKFHLSRLLGGLARECDGFRLPSSGLRLTPGKTNATQAQLSWCLCLSWAILQFEYVYFWSSYRTMKFLTLALS